MPRHVMFDVADVLEARLWFLMQAPKGVAGIIDRTVGKITGTPGMWPALWGLGRVVENDDVVFSPEMFAFVFILLCVLRRRRPTLVVDLMAPTRPRVHLALCCGFVRNRIDSVFVNNLDKVDVVAASGIDRDRISIPPDVTDEAFMCPAEHDLDRAAPVIVSSGREQRDYVTLATAATGTSWVTRVCAASANVTRKQAIALPDEPPTNMEVRHFDWPDYRTLFQDADVVVVPLLDHDYSAGLTVIFEAFAFHKPVVVTATPGTVANMVDRNLVVGVPVGDAAALRDAVERLLADDEERRNLADRGHEYFLQTATTEIFISWMTQALTHGAAAPDRPIAHA